MDPEKKTVESKSLDHLEDKKMASDFKQMYTNAKVSKNYSAILGHSTKRIPDFSRNFDLEYLEYSESKNSESKNSEYSMTNTLLWLTYLEDEYGETDWSSGEKMSGSKSFLKNISSNLESMFPNVMNTKLILSRFSTFEDKLHPYMIEEKVNEFFIFTRLIKLCSTSNSNNSFEIGIDLREIGAQYLDKLNPKQVFSKLEHILQLVSEQHSELIVSLRYCLAIESNHFSPTLRTFDHVLNMYELYKSKEPRNPKVHFFHPATYAYNKSEGFALFLSMSYLRMKHELIDSKNILIARVDKFTYRNDLKFTLSPLEKGEKYIPSLQEAIRSSYLYLQQKNTESTWRQTVEEDRSFLGDEEHLLRLQKRVDDYIQMFEKPEKIGSRDLMIARGSCFAMLYFSSKEKQQWLGKTGAKSLDRKVLSLLGDLSLNNPLNSSHQSLASFVSSEAENLDDTEHDFSIGLHLDAMLFHLDMCMLNLIRSESENNRFTGLNGLNEIDVRLRDSLDGEISANSFENTDTNISQSRHKTAEKILSQHFKTISMTESNKNTLSRTNKISRLGAYAHVLLNLRDFGTLEIYSARKNTKFKKLERLRQPIRLNMKGVNHDSPNGLKINILLHRYLELINQIESIHSLLDNEHLGFEFGMIPVEFTHRNQKSYTLLTSLSVLACIDLCLLHYTASHIEPNHHESNYILRKTIEQLVRVEGSIWSFCSDYPCDDSNSSIESQKAFTFESQSDLFYRPQSLRIIQPRTGSVTPESNESLMKGIGVKLEPRVLRVHFSPQHLFEILKSHCFPLDFEGLKLEEQNQHRFFVSKIEQFLKTSDPHLSDLNDLLSELKKHHDRNSASLGGI